MEYPTTRLVFDRKNKASAKRKGVIHLEVRFGRKRKWASTGVMVYADQWSDKNYIVHALDKDALNRRIVDFKTKVDDWITDLMSKSQPFTWDAFDAMLKYTAPARHESFIDYVRRRIDERNDIKASTKKNHRKLITSLEDYGKIIEFTDLTRGNISDYYNYLRGKIVGEGENAHVMRQLTVSSYIKFLKIYINDAIVHDLMASNPTIGIKIKRGESEQGRWLTEDDIKLIEDYKAENVSMRKVRDMFLTQCYTGMAYADLIDFSPEKIENADDVMVLRGKRVKTGEDYTVVVLESMREILERYNYKLPRMTVQQYNMRLKLLATACKIDKPLSSHWGRRTCGMLMLNKGYPIEIVAKVLGHSDIRTTQHAYAKIMDKTVIEAFKKVEGGK
ncbi:MAG: site-specific integrase [Prevotella sp.]|nr:site-specific integrase [Prevotella sp.]